MTNHTSDVTGLAFTPDGRQLISASDDGTIRLWNVSDLTECRRLLSSHEQLTTLAMLPDDPTLVSGGKGGSVCFWDLSVTNRAPGSFSMRVSSRIESLAEVDVPGYARDRLDPRVVRRCGGAFTPDSRHFLTLDSTGALALWDVHPARLVENLPAFGSNHWGVALSSDARWLITGDSVDQHGWFSPTLGRRHGAGVGESARPSGTDPERGAITRWPPVGHGWPKSD